MTFEEIQKANDNVKSEKVKDKDYITVSQRIKAFRMCHPNGSITTEFVSLENGVAIMKAVVRDEEGKVLGEGHAYEKEGSTFINKTSYIENCETSAVGRALGMCGFGIDKSVASAEEVANAKANQEETATEKQIKLFRKYYTGQALFKLLSDNGIKELKDLPKAKADELEAKLQEMIEAKKGESSNPLESAAETY